MAFMDKLKAAAQDVGEKTKSAASQAKDKMDDMQTRKKMDEAAKKIGYLIYRERTEGTPAGSEADQLVNEITTLQAQLDAEKAPQNVAEISGTETAPPAAPEGDTTS